MAGRKKTLAPAGAACYRKDNATLLHALKTSNSESNLVKVNESEVCCTNEWEAAYLRFETPEEEIHKFVTRLKSFGADRWPRDAKIVELFCGRGNGLRALHQLGFTNLEGADLSASLLSKYDGPGKCYVADCRRLPFESGSKDIVVIQGGLHHLREFPGDLEQTLSEVARVLAPGGRIITVEPWLTPFLRFVHWVSSITFFRRIAPKVDAFAVMTENERETYDQWLGAPDVILSLFKKEFTTVSCRIRLGKLMYDGRRS